MKHRLFIFIFFFSVYGYSQDNWRYDISFQLNHYPTKFVFQEFQLFLYDVAYQHTQKRELKYDSSTDKYTLSLEYSCSRCGHKHNLPPDIYLKINYLETKTNTNLSTFIPIVFEGTRPRILPPFDLGTIPVMDFINGFRLDEDNFSQPPHVAIRVDHYSKISFLSKYEYQWKKMQELIEVKLND